MIRPISRWIVLHLDLIHCDCRQLDDTKSYCQLIINITLSQNLRSGKTKLVKNSENPHFTILYKNGVWFSRLAVTLVIILKFVTGLPNCPITKPISWKYMAF